MRMLESLPEEIADNGYKHVYVSQSCPNYALVHTELDSHNIGKSLRSLSANSRLIRHFERAFRHTSSTSTHRTDPAASWSQRPLAALPALPVPPPQYPCSSLVAAPQTCPGTQHLRSFLSELSCSPICMAIKKHALRTGQASKRLPIGTRDISCECRGLAQVCRKPSYTCEAG